MNDPTLRPIPACQCGAPIRHTSRITVTPTGRESWVGLCSDCGMLTYWHEHAAFPGKWLIANYVPKPAGAKKWPKTGWDRRVPCT
jgi:hypothetical protein